MDSCIIANECIDEMASVFGRGAEVSAITAQAMKEGLDFDEALRLRLNLLKGMTKQQLQSVWPKLQLNSGAERLIRILKQFGCKTAIISGGFTFFAHKIAHLLGADYAFSNTLEFDDNGVFLGTVTAPIVNGQMKERILQTLAAKEAVPLRQVIAMGDGANDRWMVSRAGLGVAYHAKAILKAATPHHLNCCPLDSLLYFLPNAGSMTWTRSSSSLQELLLLTDTAKLQPTTYVALKDFFFVELK